MNIYNLSVFRRIFNNDKSYIININSFEINSIKSRLLSNTESNMFDAMQNKSVFFGKINDVFSLNRNFLIINNEGNFAKMYHVKGVFRENELILKFDFAFPNLFYFIWVLLFPLVSILGYIIGTNKSLIYFGVPGYIFLDFFYNLFFYLLKNTFKNDFIRFLEPDKNFQSTVGGESTRWNRQEH